MGDKVEAFREGYARYGALIILLKGVTPIPYKIVTITSGFAGYNVFLFVLFSIIARAMRFYAVAFIAHRYGPRARAIIEKRLELWVGAGGIILVAGIFIAVRMFWSLRNFGAVPAASY